MASILAGAVTIVIAGWLWFFIVRPILEDWGVIGGGETVKPAPPLMQSLPLPQPQTVETDEADGPSVSAVISSWERTRLDKTRVAWIELMLYSGYTTAEIRALLKGENGAIGQEVDAARKRLGIVAPDRQLRVKDEKGERMIPLAAR